MTSRWIYKRLEDAVDRTCSLSYGIVQPGEDVQDGLPVVRPTDLRSRVVGLSGLKRIDPTLAIPYERTRLHGGELLLCVRGDTGSVSVAAHELSGANVTRGIVPIRFDTSTVLQEFGYYAFVAASMQAQIKAATYGAALMQINIRDLRKIIIPVPPLDVQKRIVAILDEAFEGIDTAVANTGKNLANAREIFDSYLKDVFSQEHAGWSASKLKQLTTKIGSGATPRGGEESYKTEGISLIRSLNVHDLSFKYPKLAFLDKEQADALSNVEVHRHDVLLNITGASIARCCLVPENVLPARVNQHVAIIRPAATKLDSSFLHYLLISKPYKSSLLLTGEDGGTTRQALTKAQLEDFAVACPEALEQQQAIVENLDMMLAEYQSLEAIYRRKLALFEGLKRSILQKAFSDELAAHPEKALPEAAE